MIVALRPLSESKNSLAASRHMIDPLMPCPIPKEVLDNLTQKSKACIDNFADYLATLEPVDSSVIHLSY